MSDQGKVYTVKAGTHLEVLQTEVLCEVVLDGGDDRLQGACEDDLEGGQGRIVWQDMLHYLCQVLIV